MAKGLPPGRPRSPIKSVVISVRVPTNLSDAIDEKVKESGLKRNRWLNLALVKAVREKEAEQEPAQ